MNKARKIVREELLKEGIHTKDLANHLSAVLEHALLESVNYETMLENILDDYDLIEVDVDDLKKIVDMTIDIPNVEKTIKKILKSKNLK
jgi:hypothetical protein